MATPLPLPAPERVLLDVLALLKRAPENLRTQLAAHSEPLIAFTPRRVMLAANAAAEAFFGYGPGELEGRPTDDIVPARLRQPDAPPMPPSADVTTVHLPGLRRDQSEVAAAWTFGAFGTPAEPIFVMLIRDRELAERAVQDTLQRSDARYTALFRASDAVIWHTNSVGEVVELQPAWHEYTGQTWEDYRDSGWIRALHPNDRERLEQDWKRAVINAEPVFITQGRVWSAKHQSYRAFQARAVPVRNAAGEVVEWVGAMTDVEDVVRAQQKLRETQNRHEVLFAESPLALSLTRTEDWVTVAVNAAFLSLFELEREQVVGEQHLLPALTAERGAELARAGEDRRARES